MDDQESTTPRQKVTITFDETPDRNPKQIAVEMSFDPPVQDESLDSLLASGSAPTRTAALVMQFLQLLGSAKGNALVAVLNTLFTDIAQDQEENTSDACEKGDCCGGQCHEENKASTTETA